MISHTENVTARDMLEINNRLQNTIDDLNKSKDEVIKDLLSIIRSLILSSIPSLPSLNQLPSTSPLSTQSQLIQPPSTQPSTQPSSIQSESTQSLIYSANGVKLCTNNNWVLPTEIFINPCFICNYYGHGFRTCPNIQEK